jgi:hypothetical protein
MNDILRAVADVGFPIVIAVYLLMVFGGKLDRLSDAVEKLSRYVEGLGKRDSTRSVIERTAITEDYEGFGAK